MLNRKNLRQRSLQKKRQQEQLSQRNKKRLIIEMLEQRMVLASDFLFDAIADQRPAFQVTLASDGANLRVIDSSNGAVLKTQAISDNSGRILITGSAQPESLTIDETLPTAITVVFVGGDGIDTLNGPRRDSEWNVTGLNQGQLNTAIQFSGVENLLGSTDNQDTFRFKPGPVLAG